MRISDWSSDVCSSDLTRIALHQEPRRQQFFKIKHRRLAARHPHVNVDLHAALSFPLFESVVAGQIAWPLAFCAGTDSARAKLDDFPGMPLAAREPAVIGYRHTLPHLYHPAVRHTPLNEKLMWVGGTI